MDYYGIQYEPEMIEKANFYTLSNTDPSQSLKINVSYVSAHGITVVFLQ